MSGTHRRKAVLFSRGLTFFQPHWTTHFSLNQSLNLRSIVYKHFLCLQYSPCILIDYLLTRQFCSASQ